MKRFVLLAARVATPTQVLENGFVVIEGGSVSEVGNELIAEIPESQRDTTRLFLRGDAELPYKKVLDLMNELKAGGFYKISIVGHEAVK